MADACHCSFQKEDNPTVRSFVSATLSRLVGLCANRQPNPNNKLIKNLCSFLRCSTVSCPTAESMTQEFSGIACGVAFFSLDSHNSDIGTVLLLLFSRTSLEFQPQHSNELVTTVL